MPRFLFTIPKWFQSLFTQYIWQIPTSKREYFLTFDDGPDPQITPFILDLLDQYQAQATFFCVGENVLRYPNVVEEIVSRGHRLGNHTFNHLNGWKVGKKEYFDNVIQCEKVLGNFQKSNKLFRPPYGRITRGQSRLLADFNIVMWNRLTWDFNPNLDVEKTKKYLLKPTPKGSIFVFHDNEKSFKNVQALLPSILNYFTHNDFTFSKLD